MNIQRGTIRYRYGRSEFNNTFRVGGDGRSPGIDLKSEMIPVERGWRIRLTLVPQGEIAVRELSLEGNFRFSAGDRIFCNGFQSWTDSREFSIHDRMKSLSPPARLFKLPRFGDSHFYPYPGKKGMLHSHTYSYIATENGETILLGSLSEDYGYTIVAVDTGKNHIMVVKDAEGMTLRDRRVVMDLLLLNGARRDILDDYFAACCPSPRRPGNRTGWTSWYNHYTGITEDIILKNLDAAAGSAIPLDIFQIDDGYQTAVGDWLTARPAFPRGMRFLAESIKSRGYRAGIWLAPFICEGRSSLMRNNAEWALTDNGRPVAAGWNPLWSGTFYALDIFNEEVRDYLRDVFETVLDGWGYDMVKLDFLYAAALLPRGGRSRGEVMAEGMKFLRRLAGDRLLLGCGVPLGAAFGRADFCRIGSDVALKWEDRLLRAIRYRERVSTVNSLTSTVGRGHLNGRVFVNDPDVVILRAENNSLTADQRYSLFLINNVFGGLIFTSDDISAYAPALLKLYRSMFPLLEKKNLEITHRDELAVIRFGIGNASYTVFANLSPKRTAAVLDEGLYFRSAAEGDERFMNGGESMTLRPYESRCYRTVAGDFFTVAGTTAHLFPGSEIVTCEQRGNSIVVAQDDRVRNENTVYIRTPGPGQYIVNGRTVQAQKVMDRLFLLEIEIKGDRHETIPAPR